MTEPPVEPPPTGDDDWATGVGPPAAPGPWDLYLDTASGDVWENTDDTADPPIPAYPELCWPVDHACLGEDWWTTYDQMTRARADALAIQTLRSLTGYRVGGCPITLRPCRRSCWPDRGPTYREWAVTPGADEW